MKSRTIIIMTVLWMSGCLSSPASTTQPSIPTTTLESTTPLQFTSTTVSTTTTLNIFVDQALTDSFKDNPNYDTQGIVFLWDFSGFNYSDGQSDAEKYGTYLGRKKANVPQQDAIVKDLVAQNFSVLKESNDGSWFQIYLNKYVLTYLLQDNRVKSIYDGLKSLSAIRKPEINISESYLEVCASTSDCILVSKDCCYAEPDSINKKYEEYHKGNLLRQCLLSACTANAHIWNFESFCLNSSCGVKVVETPEGGILKGRIIQSHANYIWLPDGGRLLNWTVNNASGIRVVLFKDLSYVTENTTNEYGDFSLSTPPEPFGLLFYNERGVYVYDKDYVNSYLESGNANDSLLLNKSAGFIQYDIGRDLPKFSRGVVSIWVNDRNITETDLDRIINRYGLKVVKRLDENVFDVNITSNRTELEINLLLRNEKEVQSAWPDTMSFAGGG